MKILVVTDRSCPHWPQAALKRPRSHQFAVLPFGQTREGYRKKHEDLWTGLDTVDVLDVNSHSERAQESVRRYVPNLLSHLAHERDKKGCRLIDSLRWGGVNLWWFFEITEKSAYRGRWIQQLYLLALVASVLEEQTFDELWIDTDDAAFAEAILVSSVGPRLKLNLAPGAFAGNVRSWLRWPYNAFAVAWGAWSRSWIGRRENWIANVPEKADLVFSFFPLWWDRPFDVTAIERFWAGIPKKLSTSGPVGFLVWVHLSARALWENRSALSAVFREGRIAPLECFLSTVDCLSVLRPGLHWKLFRFRRATQRIPCPAFQGFNVAALVRSEIARSIGSRELWADLLIERAFRRVRERLNPRAVLFRQEFQPWEAAIVTAMKGHVPLIGFQHAAIGRNHLAYDFYAGEIGERPVFTDLILCTGNYFPEKMKNQGFPESRLAVCGPARYTEMFKYFSQDRDALRQRHAIPKTSTVFFIAMPIVEEEMNNVLAALRESLGNAERGRFFCLFKCHPAADYTKEIQAFLSAHLPDLPARILPHGVALYDFVSLSDILLSAGTTMSMEAICLNVIPIVFEDVTRFSVNPMLDVRDAVFSATNAEELACAIQTILTDPAAVEERKKNWPSAIWNVFDRVDEDPVARFARVLEEWPRPLHSNLIPDENRL